MGALLPLMLGLALPSFNPAWPARDTELTADALAREESMPDDPDFPPRGNLELGCVGQLALFSFTPGCTPQIAAAERELRLGSGIHADRAWLWTTGRPEIKIAIADSGIDWSNVDLILRFALNSGELPNPDTGGTHRAYDANGDGIFNVQDYTTATGTTAPTPGMVIDESLTRRSDRGDANGNGLLDPQDLILIFSNGIDNDDNGYVDDICGWDFLSGDNDPADPAPSPKESFGTQQAKAAVATANNGIGGAGVCPLCSAIPVRVSQRGFAPGGVLASAVAYAVDAGSRIIVTGVSSAGESKRLREVVSDAWIRNTLVIANAGTSASPRQEVLWDPDRVIVVGSIGYNKKHRDEATSAISPDPCSNYGVQLAVSAPGRCDSSAAALAAGTAGLILSASLGIKEKNVPPLSPGLSAEELYQLLVFSANDITRPLADRTDTPMTGGRAPHPPQPIKIGWDEKSGYGRINARRAIDAIVQRRIAPEIEIVSPGWLEVLDPTPGTGFVVRGRVRNRRYANASWVLEYALGISPDANTFSPIGSGAVRLGEVTDVLGTVPTSSLFRDPTAPPSFPTEFAVTIRLIASGSSGGDVVRGEARRTVFVHRDLDLLPAFPLALGAGATGSPRVLDIDGDGSEEIVVATDDGRIHAITGTGRTLAGWPVQGSDEPLLGTPAAAGFDGAFGRASSVVAATSTGKLLRYDASADLTPGYPVTLSALPSMDPTRPAGLAESPVLYDLDGDGAWEIIQSGGDGQLWVLRASGDAYPGFPVALPEPVGMPSAGDIDRDGTIDIVAMSATRLYVVHGDGMLHSGGPTHDGFPIMLPPASSDNSASGLDDLFLPAPVLGDVDRDGALDIVVATRGRPVLVYSAAGTNAIRIASLERSRFGSRSPATRAGEDLLGTGGHAALADLDGDGVLEVIHGSASGPSVSGPEPGEVERFFGAWSLAPEGAFTEGSPRTLTDPSPGGAAVADIDGDHRPEVIVGSADHGVHAFSADGTRPRLWPKLTGGPVIGAPAIGDLDGDGSLDVVAVTHSGVLFAWRTRGPRDGAIPWSGFQHDNRATGNAETPTSAFALVNLGSGCSCSNTEGGRPISSRVAWGMLVLSCVLLRRGRCAISRPTFPTRTIPG